MPLSTASTLRPSSKPFVPPCSPSLSPNSPPFRPSWPQKEQYRAIASYPRPVLSPSSKGGNLNRDQQMRNVPLVARESISPATSEPSSSRATAAAAESPLSRDLRVFGGDAGDEMDSLSADLRGRMLDVVLGLFNGMDYDDEEMLC